MNAKNFKIQTLKSFIANRSPSERRRLTQLHESYKAEMKRLRKEEQEQYKY